MPGFTGEGRAGSKCKGFHQCSTAIIFNAAVLSQLVNRIRRFPFSVPIRHTGELRHLLQRIAPIDDG
jgi:hypothetical protein